MNDQLAAAESTFAGPRGDRARSLAVSLAVGPEPASWSGVRLLARSAESATALAATEQLREREMVCQVLGLEGLPRRNRALPMRGSPILTSHLTHNWIPRWPFLTDLAEAVARLLGGCVEEIRVPSLRSVDAESLLTLQALALRSDIPMAKLRIACDEMETADVPDERGIVWSTPSHLLRRLVSSFCGAARRGSSRIEILEGSAPGLPPVVAAREASSPHGEGSPRARLARVREWFHTYGFTSALRDGLALLDQDPRLAPSEMAELYHLVGLAAHNRQFQSTADKKLEHFLWDCFSRAYALETDLERRAALCYRLAVVAGRRLKRRDEGEVWAERGIALAKDLPEPQSSYQSAWCHNIRALFQVQRQEPRQALADTAASLSRLEIPPERQGKPGSDLIARDWDLLATRHILMNYCVTLAALCADRSRGLAWIDRSRDFVTIFPAAEYLDAPTVIDFYHLVGDVRAALALSEKARQQAAEALDFTRHFQLTCEAGGFADRLGDHDRAAALFQEARVVRNQLGRPAFFPSLDLPLAAVLLRGGRLAAAEDLLNAALKEEALSSAHHRSEIWSLLAACAAGRGERESAEERINASIEAALESGTEAALIQSALAAGEVALVLADLPTAQEAFLRAGDLLAPALAEADGALAALGVRLICGLWNADLRTTAELRSWTELTVRQAWRALADPVSWSLLDPWAAAIRACGEHWPAGDPDLRTGLQRIEKARSESALYQSTGGNAPL